MKTNLKKKALLPVVAMLVASVIALSGVSYAWFSLSETAKLTGIDVNVQSASGIKISAQDGNYSGWVTYDDIKAQAGNTIPKELIPVSTANEISFLAAVENKDDPSKLDITASTGNEYLKFNLYFNLDKAAEIYLDNGDGSKTEDGFANDGTASTLTYKSTEGNDLPKFARVGFVAPGSTTAVIWEPGKGTTSYKAVVKGAGTTAAPADVESATAVTTFEACGIANNAKLFDLPAGVSMVTVYVWAEGQDAECINANAGGNLLVDLGFSKIDK